MTANERTLILIKPDAIHRSLVGEVISRLEKKLAMSKEFEAYRKANGVM